MAETLQGRWRWMGFVAAGLMGAVAGNLFGVARADFGGQGGFGGHHGFFTRHGRGGPEQMGEHAQFAVDMAFRAVGASDDQRAQAKAIVERHAAAAKALHEKHADNRAAGVAALSGATVDRDKLEAVRQAQMELADEASKELTAGLAELADVLTPDQRGQLLQIAQRFHR